MTRVIPKSAGSKRGIYASVSAPTKQLYSIGNCMQRMKSSRRQCRQLISTRGGRMGRQLSGLAGGCRDRQARGPVEVRTVGGRLYWACALRNPKPLRSKIPVTVHQTWPIKAVERCCMMCVNLAACYMAGTDWVIPAITNEVAISDTRDSNQTLAIGFSQKDQGPRTR